jgi:prophage regulatory protein
MDDSFRAAVELWRRKQVDRVTGRKRSSTYEDIADGLMVPPVPIGRRAVAWPRAEVEAVITARIAGKSPDEIRELVAMLVAGRTDAVLGSSMTAQAVHAPQPRGS